MPVLSMRGIRPKPATGRGESVMFSLGKLIAAPVRIVNAPLRAIEDVLSDDPPESERLISKPLGALGDELEKAVDGEES